MRHEGDPAARRRRDAGAFVVAAAGDGILYDEPDAPACDRGRIPESKEIHDFWEQEMSEFYDDRIRKMKEERRRR